MFLDCPAYADRTGAKRCGLPAEFESRYIIWSSDGPLESAKIRCPRGHWFNGPMDSLIVPASQPEPRLEQPASGAGQQDLRVAESARAAARPGPPLPGHGQAPGMASLRLAWA